MPRSKLFPPIIVLAICWHAAPLAAADTRSFTVRFAGCTEFFGWGPVSFAAAQPLVPAGYVISEAANGQAAIVVRATSCADVSVDQSPPQPTELSQIGINLVAPDGTGDINNYTVQSVSPPVLPGTNRQESVKSARWQRIAASCQCSLPCEPWGEEERGKPALPVRQFPPWSQNPATQLLDGAVHPIEGRPSTRQDAPISL